jgi:hypothetical protein
MSAAPLITRVHRTRLMQVWRSAGWPCQDALEIDLLAAGLLVLQAVDGRATVQLTAAGIALLAESRVRQRRAASLHDRVAARFAQQLVAEGRIVWHELAVRCAVADATRAAPAAPAHDLWPEGEPPAAAAGHRWRYARPDLFSLRNTTVEAYLQPMVHEVKASRADLLADLRDASKREAYGWLAGACSYVFPSGVATPEDVPDDCGVWVLHGDPDETTARFEQLRAPRHTERRLPFAVWMALAKAGPVPLREGEPLQPFLDAAA